ncbi:putative folylpolyglutamate synthase [Smittium culicis]|uniref:tetrahydrofolate synthase n=1 Tax=Smittium culicis TaxID=133412 RepID=A0A1R1XGV4_9FUNG|nr:putative folylpolyglutamate synthase [Smittium culicis]
MLIEANNEYINSNLDAVKDENLIKTSLFTSPHLVSVTERIRIDGKQISRQKFTEYFYQVYESLSKEAEKGSSKDMENRAASEACKVGDNVQDKHQLPVRTMPQYFAFLTILAFYSWLKEGVNAAVVEVGIGGEYDSTNIIPSPITTAITSIGLDHVEILGRDIPSISWHKAGIMKPNSTVIVHPDTQPEALRVFQSRAEEKNATLKVCRRLDLSLNPGNVAQSISPDQKSEEKNELKRGSNGSSDKTSDQEGAGISGMSQTGSESSSAFLKLGIDGAHQVQNAAIAIETVFDWMSKTGNDKKLGLEIPKLKLGEAYSVRNLPRWVVRALSSTFWPGRSQHFVSENYKGISWYIDGAHTVDSLQSSKWAKYDGTDKATVKGTENKEGGENHLKISEFKDLEDYVHGIFLELSSSGSLDGADGKTSSFGSINEAFDYITTEFVDTRLGDSVGEGGSSSGGINVLVCGSLHLVGGIIDLAKAPSF